MMNRILKTKDKLLVAVLKKDQKKKVIKNNLYNYGVVAAVTRMTNFPDENYRVIIQGKKRVKIKEIFINDNEKSAEVIPVEDINTNPGITEALHRSLENAFSELINETPAIPQELKIVIKEIDNSGSLADFVSMHISMDLSNRQKILEMFDIQKRLKYVLEKIVSELEVAKAASKIRKSVEKRTEDSRKEYFLREQLKAIKKELGEGDDYTKEIDELYEQLDKAKLSEEAIKAVEKELDRMKMMPPSSAEYTVSRTYVDWILELPWNKFSKDKTDISNAKKILNNDHYDLKNIKERILEFIAVRKLKPNVKSPIICFVGPPGVGKTSLGQSIARALNRKFVRFSLGGIKDESEIRGHRRTYVGALPGRILQGIRRAGTVNPLYMLDEIDKLGYDFRGDPASALLEVLDPEQNSTFRDHYLDLSFDLSNVMFIMTANTTATIPPALYDRMEILELPGYTTDEKLEIAKRHLLPRQIIENGLKGKGIKFNDSSILSIVENYTYEAGVRSLERKIAQVCRRFAKKIASKNNSKKKIDLKITEKVIEKELGPSRNIHETKLEKPTIGVSTGMAWTQYGGEILLIEVLSISGKGDLILTGQLGEVMKESVMAGLSYLKANSKSLKIDKEIFEKNDFHIHVPAGAIPKDGPSAGVAIISAIYSRITKKPVRNDIAITGEITLTGRILAVGGIDNKILAAKRAGIFNILLPMENKPDYIHMEKEKKHGMKFFFVDNISKAFKKIF